MAHWVGAQGQVKLARKRNTPIWDIPPENSKLGSKNFFLSKLEDFSNP